MATTGFTSMERRAILSLSGIYALRMLGLFMILPVFSLDAHHFKGATPFRIGIALGIYGFTQAVCQIPFGYLSDRLGRKPLIIIGLLFFALGSGMAALSHSIFGIILGRGLQGVGAIGSVIMALLTDLTREEVRLRAMASIGITIGLSFTLSFVLGPLLYAWGGISSIFWITCFLALIAIGVIVFAIPNPPLNTASIPLSSISRPGSFMPLSTLYAGVFILHASLTALFLKIPEAVVYLVPEDTVYRFYGPILLGSLITTLPILLYLEKRQSLKNPLSLVILGLGLSELGILCFSRSFIGLGSCLCLFFTAFNILEASLPSLISKQVSPHHKGKALGIFSALQFLGLFTGGVVGGSLNSWGGLVAVLGFCVILALAQLVLVFFSIDIKRFSYGKRLK